MKLQEAHELLEEAMTRVVGSGHVGLDLPAVEEAFAGALRHLYGALSALDNGTAREQVMHAVAGIDETMAILQRTGGKNGVAEPLLMLGEARQGLATAVVAVHDAREERRPTPPGFLRASLDEPQLLDWARPVLRPTLPLPEPPDKPLAPPAVEDDPSDGPTVSTLAEVQALLKETAALGAPEEEEPPAEEVTEAPPPLDVAAAEDEHFGRALTQDEVLFERTRSCVEDLAMLSQMRTPLEDQGWVGRARPEQRLLARVDALAALGEERWPWLVRLLERPLPDPGLWWANLFFFGALSGQDALDQVVRLLKVAPLELPEVRVAVADALAFAPHAGLSDALRPLLRAPVPGRRWIAVTALSRRGAVTAEELLLLCRDSDESVVEAAARALGRARGQMNAGVLRMLLHRPEEAIVRAAMESAFVWRAPIGLSRARDLCGEGRAEFGDSGMFLAVGSEGQDAEILLGAAARKSAKAVEGLGWYGDLKAVDPLLELLEDDSLAPTVAESLQRLTGASISEDGPPELEETEPQPFTPSYHSPELAGLLSTEHEAWAVWWERHRAHAKVGARYRQGRLWTPEDDFRVMETPASVPRERLFAYLELCVRTGESAAFDPAAFVSQQRRQLDVWRSLHQARGGHRSGVRGGWPARWEG